MYAILFRTLFLYVLISVVIRAMGKRQVGELETSELVSTFLLSQLAALPIEDSEIPLSHVLLPILLIVTLEILVTFLKSRVNFLKRIFASRPSILIDRGRIDQKEMGRMRLTVEELMSEVRQQSLTDLSQVEYAILEKNGKLTVLPKPQYAQPTVEQMGLSPSNESLMHVVYSNGAYSKEGLRLIGKDRAWLLEELKKKKLSPDLLFCVTANDLGDLFWIEKEKQKP